MKKPFPFILALAILMLVAIPATAGPLPAPVLIESAMPALLTAPVQASINPVVSPLVFESSPPFFARITAALAPLYATSAIKPTWKYALLAALAGLTCGVGLICANSSERRLTYDPRDRMHRLPGDQTFGA